MTRAPILAPSENYTFSKYADLNILSELAPGLEAVLTISSPHLKACW